MLTQEQAITALLRGLDCKEDDLVINSEGIGVWLTSTPSGGLTSCCAAFNPCPRHQATKAKS